MKGTACLTLADGHIDDRKGREYTASSVELPENPAGEEACNFRGLQRAVLSGVLALQAIRNLCRKHNANEHDGTFDADSII